jgi:phosphoglycolate phosphatase-like HAD superfamily hydrolase
MTQPRAVLFDFDLTLVDSVQGVTDSANHALHALGLPTVGAEVVRRTIGLPLEQTLTELSGSTDPALMAGYVDAMPAAAAGVAFIGC